MNDLDNLKRKWQKIDIPADSDILPPRQNGSHEVPRSIKERLLRRLYRLMAGIALGIAIAPQFISTFDSPLWFNICYIAYFLLAAVFNFILISKLRKTDFATTTTVDAIAFVKKFITLRNRFRMILICCAVPLISMLLFVLDHENDPMVLVSGIIGTALGTYIGLLTNRRFRKELDLLRDYLGDSSDT